MRFLTFRFDDGLIRGAHKAVRALAPDKASFFVLSRPEDLRAGPYAEATAGLVFGAREDWVELSAQGHDIQPHSTTHPDFRAIDADQAAAEVVDSLAFVGALHAGPYVFAYPFNRIRPDFDLAAFGLDGAGFLTKNSAASVAFNRPGTEAFDRYQLRAWEVHEDHYEAVVAGLEGLPAPSWTILGFHSLDGEGWKPWTSEGFARLVVRVRQAGFTIVTVREMFGIFARQSAEEEFWSLVPLVWEYTRLPTPVLFNLYCATLYVIAPFLLIQIDVPFHPDRRAILRADQL